MDVPGRTYRSRFPARIPFKRWHAVGPTQLHTEPSDDDSANPNVPSRRRCGFLQLPAEVRHEIYRYLLPNGSKSFCFLTETDRTIVGPRWHRQPFSPRDSSSLAILRTNWTIYHEALSVLYSEHIFHFIGFNYLPVLDFIRRLSPEARDRIRKVRITLLTTPRLQPDGTQPGTYEHFCKVIFDFLPGLNALQADPWIWM